MTHIQNMAPGPPMDIAVATPAILPMPTVLAKAIVVAWKGVIRPSFVFFYPGEYLAECILQYKRELPDLEKTGP
jgi:hypothetical protein